MNKITLFVILVVFLGNIFILNACTPTNTSITVNETSGSPLSAGAEKIETTIAPVTPVVTDTPTPTQTPTLTPTLTNTPTITPSPTPNMVMPGNYYVGKCAEAPGQYGATISFCVTGVRVTRDRHMFFDVTWNIDKIPSDVTVSKRSDYGNRKMYLIDNLGNRYDHVNGGGAAYKSLPMFENSHTPGWFEFGSPPVGALSFDFHDDDNHMVIKGIYLIPGFGYITYDKLTLDQYPLIVEYDKDKWTPTKAADDTNMLTHKKMPTCIIQAKQPQQPQGQLKSQSKVGDITYDIYGYFDESLNLYFREYVYVSGLSGMDPNIKPFFNVTIPVENSVVCIMAASDVLARLGFPTP